MREEYDAASEMLEESAALFRKLDVPVPARNGALQPRPHRRPARRLRARDRGDTEEALSLESSHKQNAAISSYNLGSHNLQAGHLEQARDWLERTVALTLELGFKEVMAYALAAFARLCLARRRSPPRGIPGRHRRPAAGRRGPPAPAERAGALRGGEGGVGAAARRRVRRDARRGDGRAAGGGAPRGRRYSPRRLPRRRIEAMDEDGAPDFEQLVSDALDELPDDIRRPDDERRRHGRGRAAAGARTCSASTRASPGAGAARTTRAPCRTRSRSTACPLERITGGDPERLRARCAAPSSTRSPTTSASATSAWSISTATRRDWRSGVLPLQRSPTS